jgi:hypothetical protein
MHRPGVTKLVTEKHSLVVEFGYDSSDVMPIIDLEDRLIEALQATGAGELDGNWLEDGEPAPIAPDTGREGQLYFHGSDPEALLDAIRPVLTECKILRDPVALIRHINDTNGEIALRIVRLAQ